MRKTVQILLLLFALGSLILAGFAFYSIVLAANIHGAPARSVATTAGRYHLNIVFYSDAINAGDIVPFTITPASGIQGPINYAVTATPDPGIPGNVTQSDLTAQHSAPYGTTGSITFVTRGGWTMHIVVNGPAGKGQVNLPINAVAPPAIPTWLAWNIGLSPLYGLLIFWGVQIVRRRTVQVPTPSASETPHVEISHT